MAMVGGDSGASSRGEGGESGGEGWGLRGVGESGPAG